MKISNNENRGRKQTTDRQYNGQKKLTKTINNNLLNTTKIEQHEKPTKNHVWINFREYRRGNQKWTIQRNWQHWVHKTKNTQHNMYWNVERKEPCSSEGYQGISIYLVQEQCLVIIVLCSDTQCEFFFIVSILSNRFTANKNDTRGPPKFVDNICLNKC